MTRILITGGAGFIAHHLVNKVLKETDWEIVTLDRLDYSGNLNRLDDTLKEFDAETKKRFIYFSTDEVFGPAPDGIKYRENNRWLVS